MPVFLDRTAATTPASGSAPEAAGRPRGRDAATATSAHDRFVLTFHGIGTPPRGTDPGEAAVWCDRSDLDRLLDRAALDPRIEVTADDGNRSDVEVLLPALLVRGLTATVFVCAGRLGRPGYLDAMALHDLRAAGLRIGSHGWRHVSWRGLEGPDAAVEMEHARDRLQQVLGAAVVEAACPFGAYDRRTIARLRAIGMRRISTSDGGWSHARDVVRARTSAGRGRTDAVLAAIDTGPATSPLRQIPLRAKRFVKRWR